MIRHCEDRDFDVMWAIINDGAQAYRGIIPDDRWTEPYMSREKLQHEINDGVVFWGFEDAGVLVGVMGLQQVQDVTLIRHAYVRTSSQKRGIGAQLLSHLLELVTSPVLIGTWADAVWAIRFYERNGFHVVGPQEKDRLLRRYPPRRMEPSVVLLGGPPPFFIGGLPPLLPPNTTHRMSGRTEVRHVPKPWGHETIWAATDLYVGKILHINAGQKLSVQYHVQKDETVYLLSGELKYCVQMEGSDRRPT